MSSRNETIEVLREVADGEDYFARATHLRFGPKAKDVVEEAHRIASTCRMAIRDLLAQRPVAAVVVEETGPVSLP